MRNRWNARDMLTSTQGFLLALPVIASGFLLTTVPGCSGSSDSEFTEFEAMSPELSGTVSAEPAKTTSGESTSEVPTTGSNAENTPPEIEIPAVRTSSDLPADPAVSTSAAEPASQNAAGVANVASEPATQPSATTDTTLTNAQESTTDPTPPNNPTAPVDNPTTPAAPEQTPAAGVSAEQAVTPPAGPLEIKLLIPEKIFRPEKNSPALRVSYDDVDLLKVLNMEPVPVNAVEYFPEWLKGLDGATIRIRGFMYPTFEATGLTGFTLARDNGICCFVRQPKIYDIIAVELAPGVTSDYIEGKPFDVEGTFRIQPEADETALYRLFRIENARVLR